MISAKLNWPILTLFLISMVQLFFINNNIRIVMEPIVVYGKLNFYNV
jgi:hypothetical protein